MDALDLTADDLLGLSYAVQGDPNTRFLSLNRPTWPLPLDNSAQPSMSHSHPIHHSRRANTTTASSHGAPPQGPLHSHALQHHYHHQLDPQAMLNHQTSDWQLQYQHVPMPHQHHHQHQPSPPQQQQQQQQQQQYAQDALDTSPYNSYAGQLHTSPVEYTMPTSQPSMQMNAHLNATMPLDTSAYMMSTTMEPMNASMNSPMNAIPFQMSDFNNEILYQPMTGSELVPSVAGSSPTENWLEVRSLSSSDNGWSTVDFQQPRQSFESFESHNGTVFNPTQTLHIRTSSDSSSDVPQSAHSFGSGSWEEIPSFLHSPGSETNYDFVQGAMTHGMHHHDHSHDMHYHSPVHSSVTSVSPPTTSVQPYIKQSPSTTSSPSSSGLASPPAVKRRRSPTGIASKVTKTIVKKTVSSAIAKKDASLEKKKGKRKGPLRPDQRQQAHEIRKLRACLRCKFLKKTCDKGDPCGGCQPSHARLWQVPCTRIDIKDIAYFMKDWKADFERHVSLGFSVGNIKGFSTMERPIFITHGYGYYLPITAREVYVRDDKCFGMDWVESAHERPKEFEIATQKLSAGMEGVSHALLSEYIDNHIDGGFERFIDEYFEGTLFITEILKTAYRYYLKSKLPVIRKALKLVVAYNLTLHVTMVEGLSEEEAEVGKIDTDESKFFGKTIAPVMINFQVKCALADMWRELQKDILEELSQLYSSVYSGEKLKNWPTIFMLAAILLAVWEEMQFDCHYRVPDPTAVQKFCNDMESTPVGVIVGLFSAISQKLPTFSEWDTRKHHHLLASNQAVCDAMTEVRGHVTKYETYLKSRNEAKFDRQDFDSLSNKFLSKLVIRAN